MNTTNRLCLLVILTALTMARAQACSVPVFQYALEHWAADPYAITVRHNGALDADAEAALDRLRRIGATQRRVPNLALGVEVDEQAESARLEIRYPRMRPSAPPIWSGPLNEKTVAQLVDSPLRREIAKLLLSRHAAVWILIDGADRRVNEEVATQVQESLKRLEASLLLPDPQLWGIDPEGISRTPSFAMLRLARDAPEEDLFRQMLMGIEADLNDFADRPILIPIYGRGRALHALVDRGINPATLRDAASFLVAPCSCTIKDANPGVDMLMQVDWDRLVERLSAEDVVPTPGALGSFIDRAEEAERRLAEEPAP